MPTSPTSEAALYQTTKELISEHAFKVVVWVGVGLCAAVCSLRFGIRFVCFRRLFVEDYLMLAAMAVLIAIAAVIQVFLGDLYELLHVQNRMKAPGPDFSDHMAAGLRGDAISIILLIVGLWFIKLNFLLFFYRIGYQIKSYLILWWVALVVVAGCGVVNLGLIPYDCMLGSISHISVDCATESRVNHIYTVYIVSVVVDVLSDVIVICFPVLIVWKTRLNWRQKLVLSSVFLLVGFTIGVTIVRGSIFGGVYKSVTQVDRQVIDSSWMLFWWFIEYIVSFVIACLISFRSLWNSRDQTSRSRRVEAEKQRIIIMAQQSPARSSEDSSRNKWKKFRDDLCATFADLEGTTLDRNNSMRLQLESHLATMDVDFSSWGSNHSAEATAEDTKDIWKH
ncbi:hypothetical protein K458DRAFT_427676 [Lentithecium fluviatile CBS 122367]|uniref:Rhodopsin domain-containing protein n=1 Tax=Lentithecium fluviatile CBS 122367 TaxID=1168545 RepID=A0A6G1JH82_9PLEO|nr:hypothetical protein K458DRAFT_427676 [Lentithecium fluviatile CBS 122367]